MQLLEVEGDRGEDARLAARAAVAAAEGIAFDTPLAARDGPKVTADEVFPLFDDLAAANDADFTRRAPPEVVEENRERLAGYQAEAARLDAAIGRIAPVL